MVSAPSRVAAAAALLLAVGTGACGSDDTRPLPASADAVAATVATVPRWAQEAVWYQIFVERFRNGDPDNDPTLADMEGSWPHMAPEGWEPTPWGHPWYTQEDWARDSGEPFYTTVQLRRYGGDLQGVMDRLDDLEALGVTALYLNPINDAPSLHKYDARTYRHVDRNFGPDPEGDAARIAAEDPLDPTTWVWTAADSLFLELVGEVHRRGMRIILDYSWNHTGMTFWAWRDVLARGEDSPYGGWYEIERFDDPATPDTSEFSYRGWAGVRELPELKKVGRPAGQTHGAIEGTLVDPVRDHVFNVTRRWLDPNGDGDPSDGIDGFRLDVAEMVPLGFWRDYRRFVRGINPEATLVGEVWWEQWPERMYDPAPWLQGDVFDAVMNYRWYQPTRSFFARAPMGADSAGAASPALDASGWLDALEDAERRIPPEHVKAQMNLTASHDTPRFSTSIYNPGRYKYRVTPRENPEYRIDRPDAATRRIQELILVQQFTWRGAPHVWNGDEVGMWGADDPDPRKPLIWPDLVYEPETGDPRGISREPDVVEADLDLRARYAELIALRKAHLDLFVDGRVVRLAVDDANRVVVYARVLGEGEEERQAIVAFNAGDTAATVPLGVRPGPWNRGVTVGEVDGAPDEGLTLGPRSAAVWIRGAPAGGEDP